LHGRSLSAFYKGIIAREGVLSQGYFFALCAQGATPGKRAGAMTDTFKYRLFRKCKLLGVFIALSFLVYYNIDKNL
jgi:hypothetical protein